MIENDKFAAHLNIHIIVKINLRANLERCGWKMPKKRRRRKICNIRMSKNQFSLLMSIRFFISYYFLLSVVLVFTFIFDFIDRTTKKIHFNIKINIPLCELNYYFSSRLTDPQNNNKKILKTCFILLLLLLLLSGKQEP